MTVTVKLLALCLLVSAVLTWLLRSPLGVPLGFLLGIAIPVVYARVLGRRRRAGAHPTHHPYWLGFATFTETTLLANPELFPDIRSKPRVGGWGRRPVCMGRCHIDGQGVHRRAGGWGTPNAEIAGTFFLPWSRVEAFDVSKLGGKIPGLGGGVCLTLAGERGVLRAEFLGSVRAVSEALEHGRSFGS